MGQMQIMQDKYILGQSSTGAIATLGQEIRVDMQLATRNYAPNFSAFELFYGQNYYLGRYTASSGTLANGASINSTTGYVTGLGGSSNGSVTISVNVASSGTYYLAIKYLSSASVILTLLINGQGSPIQLALDATASTNVADAKTRYYPVNLNSGANTIQLYNSFSLATANIGEVDVIVDPYSSIYTIANATLGGGAYLYPSTGFIINLGGDNGGTATFTINCPSNGIYVLDILYLNGLSSYLLMKVSVDGGAPVNQYFSPTPDQYAYHAINQQVNLGSLTAGNHTIKFYNDTGGYAPLVGNVTIKLSPSITNLLANTGTLANGANVVSSSGYIQSLGGSNQGAVTLSVNVPVAGLYSLGVEYVNGNNIIGDMKISINSGLGVLYIFPKTNSNLVQDAQVYYVNVNLIAGANTIKFYNDENVTTQSPVINNIYIQQTLVDILYTATNSNILLQNGAAVQDGLIKNIGTDIGYIVLSYLNLPLAGSYTLIMSYVTTLSNAICSLDINGTNTGITYNFPVTTSTNLVDAKTKTLTLSLPSGSNTIKVYTA